VGTDGADRLVAVVASPTTPATVVRVTPSTGQVEEVRSALDSRPDEAYLPHPTVEALKTADGGIVHANVYAPRNPDAQAPEGELAPYVVFVHGGPTAHSDATLSVAAAFFTSRGIGVLDVNYGGSSGYGREYRERLRLQWGIVDVADCIAAAQALVDRGDADPARIAIRGGSAGGWTTLAAVTSSDFFACGVSYFGVAELLRFAEDTHDFESRYLDGLIGTLPQDRDVYVERAPLSHVDDVRCPVLLLQGLEDQVVPPSQSEMFRDALAAKGIPHAYLAFEGEQHGFRKAETIIAAHEAELSFYGQVMSFEPPGIPRLELS
jgi:dipeptidyl aminopeptidase/acylaminoacyl peptidase